MKKKQKYVTVFVILLFCVLARASDGGVCMNMSASEKNACLRSQGDEAYNRAVDYFMRGAAYMNSSDKERALTQLNLSKSSLLEANASYNLIYPTDPQLSEQVNAAYLQVSEKFAEASPPENTSQPTVLKSSTQSSTTLMTKVSVPQTGSQQASPSGNQILLVAGAVVVLSVVGFMFLRQKK